MVIIPWNVDRDELRALLIRKAKRRWVNEGFVRERCREKSRAELPRKIEQRNFKIYGTFKFQINNLVRNSSRGRLSLKSLVSKKFTLQNGQSLFVSKSVEVSRIRNVSFNQTSDYATAEADIIVDGNFARKQTIPVIFCMGFFAKKPKTPTLVYQLLSDDETESLELKHSLYGISRWNNALNQLAEYEVSIANSELEEASVKKNQFLYCLSSFPNQIPDRLSERYSANLKSSDTADPGWNLPAKLWAPFFCEFVLFNYRGTICSANAAASEQVIEKCLRLSRNRQARFIRAQRIRALLDHLSKMGLVRALDRDRFAIPEEPEEFQKIVLFMNGLFVVG